MFGLFSKKTQPIPVWFKTDIHNHVLPGIDDGSPDVVTSITLIEALRDLGVERVISSPHVAAVEFPNTPETLSTAFDELKIALQQAEISIPVSHSAEYRIDEELGDIGDRGEIIPYPGDYVLIENQWIQEPWNLDEIIFQLQLKGYQPILAHPERFTYYHNNMKRLDELHTRLPFQVNLLSLSGYYGKPVQKMAENLAKKGYIDFLGTDTHNMKHIEHLRKYLASAAAVRHRELTLPKLRNDKAFKKA